MIANQSQARHEHGGKERVLRAHLSGHSIVRIRMIIHNQRELWRQELWSSVQHETTS